MTAPLIQPPLGVEFEDVAVAVDDGDVGGVPAGAGDRLRIGQRCRPLADVLDVRDPIVPFPDVGIERQRVAGDEGAGRMRGIDQFRALLGVGLRQQAFAGNAHEGGIAVVAVAIRVGELERFHHGVEIFRAVELHCAQIEILQDVERLQQRRPLAAEAVLVDLVAAIGRHARRLDAGEELGEIGAFEGGVMCFEKADHFAGDVALVEAVARRHDAGAAALALMGAFGLDHAGERARQRREPDGFPGPVHGAVRLAANNADCPAIAG